MKLRIALKIMKHVEECNNNGAIVRHNECQLQNAVNRYKKTETAKQEKIFFVAYAKTYHENKRMSVDRLKSFREKWQTATVN